MNEFDDEVRVAMVVIDVSEVKDPFELQNVLKEKLGFPDFYGKNWDAFWDAITGLVMLPEKLVFIGWDDLVRNLPKDAEFLEKLIEKKNNKYPSTFVEVDYK
ncbi:barstar family protein [Brevibacillus sp. M2.1A]|uniref:barstar family protein n=1 Tax=Brevibacillus TaxID=55080 RepID=UPI00156B75C6|nr:MULTISPECIES: barstar family protein [Brevibacillus]MCC8435245.1 barstar family protein [Brevibacillus sp. M2.1A]MCE0451900.1 barstar family protein [Brevibacillus sp. AF8]